MYKLAIHVACGKMQGNKSVRLEMKSFSRFKLTDLKSSVGSEGNEGKTKRERP